MGAHYQALFKEDMCEPNCALIYYKYYAEILLCEINYVINLCYIMNKVFYGCLKYILS